jgi:hypothetical protein
MLVFKQPTIGCLLSPAWLLCLRLLVGSREATLCCLLSQAMLLLLHPLGLQV